MNATRGSHQNLRIFTVLLVGLLLSVSVPEATQVMSLNLEQMTERAALIFSGTCLEARVEEDPILERPVTVARFRIQRLVKGRAGSEVTIRLIGDLTGPRVDLGVPRIRGEEEVILFLYGESSLGLVSPVGLGQGKFSILVDKQGRKIAVNGVKNKNLLRGLSQRAIQRAGDAISLVKSNEGVTAETLLDIVRSLQ